MTYTGGTPHKTHVIITILTLIILAGILGFFVYQQRPEVREANFSDRSPEIPGGDFSGWPTYRNEEYGFEIRLPDLIDIHPTILNEPDRRLARSDEKLDRL